MPQIVGSLSVITETQTDFRLLFLTCHNPGWYGHLRVNQCIEDFFLHVKADLNFYVSISILFERQRDLERHTERDLPSFSLLPSGWDWARPK